MASDDIKKRLRQYLNPAIKGKFTNAILSALAAGDELNQQNLLAAKQQLFIATASGTFLDRLLAAKGVTRPPGVGISDDLFRQIGIKQTTNKLVTNIFLDVLEIFYGEEAIRANVMSTRPEGYVLSTGMTLLLKVDGRSDVLNITFDAADFTNIANASATEVAAAISRSAFNHGFTLSASAVVSPVDGLRYVQLLSGTKGPKSAVTVVGGSAQNVLRFPEARNAIPNVGTEFTTSFDGPYVKFTWTGGPDPELQFVNQGDYVNIYGAGYLDTNQGTFEIQSVQGGPVNEAYFEIINPNFVPQGPVVLAQVGGASGGGKVVNSASISSSPTGTVRSSNVVTVTTQTAHGFAPGQKVTISNVDNTSFNGTFTIITAGGSTFTYNQLGVDVASGSGTASVSYDIAVSPTGAVRSGGTTTVTTTTNHNLTVSQTVQVLGVADSSFNGNFTITAVGANTFEYIQDESNDVTFFNPKRFVIQSQVRYASVYEANPYEIVVFLPATTKIVKRELIGSWHLHNSALDRDFLGSYTFDPTTGFPVTKTATRLTEDIFAGQLKTVGFGMDTSQFPDEEGFLVFEWGTDKQEGPVRYLGRPSSASLLLDPSYKFKKTHLAGADIRVIADRKAYKPKTDGTDYQAYVTGTIKGRIEAEALIDKLKAAGIFLNVVIVYPEGPGLHDVPGYVYAGDFS